MSDPGRRPDDGALLQLRNVTCRYDRDAVLDRVDLSIGAGQFTGIVGPSGSGKTTLLKVLLGAIDVADGEVNRAPGLRIGYVPQVETVDWNFPVTVAQCVLMARTRGRLLPWPSASERRDTAAVLDRLGIGDLADRHIRQLSGGQQQRVFVARALMADPQLLVMDEPTSGVDATTRHDVLHLLDDLHRAGTAIVLTTHDLNGIASHLPHLVCLATRVIAEGTPHEVLSADVLERTFGAPMEVLQHAGVPLVVDHRAHRAHLHHRVIPLRASAS